MCGENWIDSNLRDVQAWREEGLALTVSSNEAAKLFDSVLRQTISYNHSSLPGDIERRKKRMMEEEPDFVMGETLLLGLKALYNAETPRRDMAFAQRLAELKARAELKCCTQRELRHVEAVDLLAHGFTRQACAVWEALVQARPNDLLALKFLYDSYFFVGNYRGTRDVPAAVLRRWQPAEPHLRAYLHGIYAYGLEECGQRDECRQQAALGLSYNRKCGWCVHAVAHCYEMESDYEGGLRFMDSTRANWGYCSSLVPHNIWHTALFNVEKGDFETALSIYDKEMRPRRSGIILDITDSCSLLQRLKYEGVEVGAERWRELLALAEPHLDDHALLFNDAHFSIVVSNSFDLGEEEIRFNELCRRHLRSMNNYSKSEKGDNAELTQRIGLALCEAVYEYNMGLFAEAFTRIRGLDLVPMGGSWAQRDVFVQLMIHAGLRSRDEAMMAQALAMLAKRATIKPNSSTAERLLAKHRENAFD